MQKNIDRYNVYRAKQKKNLLNIYGEEIKSEKVEEDKSNVEK